MEKLSKRYVMILLSSSTIAFYFTDKEYSEEVVLYSLHIMVIQYLETNKVQLAGEYHGRTELNRYGTKVLNCMIISNIDESIII